MTTRTIKLDLLRLDGDTQPRVAIDQDTVAEYAEAMDAGKEFPPVEVYHDGAEYWLVDGFHRYHAALKLSRTEIVAIIKTGMKTDAQWASLAMNQGHGLRRSNADKQKALFKALKLKPGMADRAIAEHIGVGHVMVSRYRANMTSGENSRVSLKHVTMRTGRDGKTYSNERFQSRTERQRENQISARALTPIRKVVPRPMMAMSMPYDPVAGAKALMVLFDRDYVTKLVAELQILLANPEKPNLLDPIQ